MARRPKVTQQKRARERARQAVILQDQGKTKDARELLLQNASEIRALTATMPSSERMRDLERRYYSLGTQAAPAPADRKILRQIDSGAAGAAVRY